MHAVPAMKTLPRETGGLVLLGNTYGEDFHGGKR
jgi:hypothetical protein